MNGPPPRLIFVYNAEAGVAAGLRDSIHKLVSPSTYPCSLCGTTYGFAGMRAEWRAWLDRQAVEAVFHHRSDFQAAFPEYARERLPLVALQRGMAFTVLVTAHELKTLTSIDRLTATIEERLGAGLSEPPLSPGP